MNLNGIGGKMYTGMEKMGIIGEKENPRVQTTGDPSDTFDHFKGVDLGIIKIGRFTDADKTEKTETVTDKEGAAYMKQIVEKGSWKNVEVSPEVPQTTVETRNETFRGITLGSRWKIGKSTIDCSTGGSKTFTVKADIPIGGGLAHSVTQFNASIPHLQWNEERAGFFRS